MQWLVGTDSERRGVVQECLPDQMNDCFGQCISLGKKWWCETLLDVKIKWRRIEKKKKNKKAKERMYKNAFYTDAMFTGRKNQILSPTLERWNHERALWLHLKSFIRRNLLIQTMSAQ